VNQAAPVTVIVKAMNGSVISSMKTLDIADLVHPLTAARTLVSPLNMV